MKRILAALVLLCCLTSQAFAAVSQSVLDLAHRNSVVIYTVFKMENGKHFIFPYLTRGSGTVYRTDNDSTWILTAAHLKEAAPKGLVSDYIEVVFEDGSKYQGFVSYCFQKVDQMIIHVPGIRWGSYSGVEAVGQEHHVFSFTTKKLQTGEADFFDGKVDTDIEEGYVYGEPEMTEVGYTENEDGTIDIRHFMMQRATFTAWPGMSGGGVFDADNGMLIGPVNACCDEKGYMDFTPTLKSYEWEGSNLIHDLFPWLP